MPQLSVVVHEPSLRGSKDALEPGSLTQLCSVGIGGGHSGLQGAGLAGEVLA